MRRVARAPRRIALVAGLWLILLPGCAGKSSSSTTAPTPPSTTATTAPPPVPGAQRLSFKMGPIKIEPGQNAIQYQGRSVPKPDVDGWIVRIAPNLERADGSVPGVDVIHLHHGVWLNQSRKDETDPTLPERFFAAGEEKTTMQVPQGYGYRYNASDRWLINYMIHNLTPVEDQVWITYDIDFIPATAPQAQGMKKAKPAWLDVQNGSVYPVFDALKGSGQNGVFTYPDDDPNAYKGGKPLNQWTVPNDMVLISTAGHLHPGGLHDDLDLQRGGNSAHLFTSDAHYFEPAGAVSWDVAMTNTAPDWRVTVKAGDVLSVHTSYDTSAISWYESMGIMVVWYTDGTGGNDPFTTPVDQPGLLNHGHLPENDNHGGAPNALPDPGTLPSGAPASQLNIKDFTYGAGDYSEGPADIPTVAPGGTITFDNQDAPTGVGIWHTITACAAPCNASTGIAYPRADAQVQFDSGELGAAGPPTSGHVSWTTPTDLVPGTYSYFCRIHPFMRGAFRVVTSG
jgi:plastocyanin